MMTFNFLIYDTTIFTREIYSSDRVDGCLLVGDPLHRPLGLIGGGSDS